MDFLFSDTRSRIVSSVLQTLNLCCVPIKASGCPVFILPPSARELENRLRNRSKDTLETDTQIRDRMSKANDEMSHYSEYDYVLINQDIGKTIDQAQMILDAERLKRRRLVGLSDFVRGVKDGL